MTRQIPILMTLLTATLLTGAVSAGELRGTVSCPGLRNCADAVVYIDEIPGKTFDPPSEPARIDQRDMLFVPHVLPVLVGTKVEFLNSDPFMHNVFTPDKCADKFNLGSWPKGQSRSFVFKNPCAAVVLCNVHPEMEGFVFVSPTPYFAVTAKDGTFAIADVPAGKYTIRVWHPKLKEASSEIVVATEAVTFDVEIKR